MILDLQRCPRILFIFIANWDFGVHLDIHPVVVDFGAGKVVEFGILEMAYRRKQQGISKSPTFEEFVEDEGTQKPPPPSSRPSYISFAGAPNDIDSSLPSSPSSLAAKAIRASSARRGSSLSSAYGHSNLSPASPNVEPIRPMPPPSKVLYLLISNNMQYESYDTCLLWFAEQQYLNCIFACVNS